MKQLLSALTIFALVFTYSCKVGEEDSASLKSRDKRIVGTWTMTSGTVASTIDQTTVASGGGEFTRVTVTKVNLTGSKELTTRTVTEDGIPDVVNEDGVYSLIVEISEGGNLKITEERQYIELDKTYQQSIVSEGTWLWRNSDKNKSAITFIQNRALKFFSGPFTVVRLSKDELILEGGFNDSQINTNDDNSQSILKQDMNIRMTFSKSE